jgi:exportin-2 (importin alpha re-exporter)
MLAEYGSDPENKWASKDAAIHLMMGIAIRRESSQAGVSEIIESVNVMDFFQNYVFPELQDSNHGSRPVVKATSLKFVAVFRNQFSKDHLIQLIPMVIMHLNSPVVVVHTFAAYVLERILMTKDSIEKGGRQKIGSAELRGFLNTLFVSLFSIVDNELLNENDYVMKCLMRSLATAGPDIVSFTQTCMVKLTGALIRVAKNPGNPQYNHYLFESIAVLVKNVCSQDPNATA